MTQMTNRLQDQKIIEIAKQQFEQTKKNKLPVTIVDLPSNGKVYPEEHPLHSGTIEMRYMTAYDEDILTDVSYIKNGVVFDKLLESIITTQISISDIIEADKDALIIAARINAYGSEYPVTVTDPVTNKPIDAVIDLHKLTAKPFTLTPDENGEFSYEINSETQIKFTYRIKSGDTTISKFLLDSITEINGNRSSSDIESFIRYEFLAGPAKKFRQYISDNAPGLNMTYDFEGDDGSTFNTRFPIGADLFWF